MNIKKTGFRGLYIIDNIRIVDDRGFFEKKYNQDLLKDLNIKVGESYVSLSKKGVLRGLHYQKGEASQSKLVTCIRGSFLDIAVDLRKSEPTFGRVFIKEIDCRQPVSVFVPGEFAHGIYSLEEDTVLLNHAGSVYSPGNEGGINWASIDELTFINNPIVSEKDLNLPNLDEVLESI